MWTDSLDHFVGMQLEVNNKKYFGWIRCQVFQSPLKLIVKDYAFQNTPRKGIPAGAEFDGDSCVDLHEPNNTRNLATPLLRYIGTHGAIDNPMDKDWYVITVPQG